MDKIMLPIEFMKIGYALIIPLLIMRVLVYLLRKNEVMECFFCLAKTISYIGLAVFLFLYYKSKKEVDSITAFTFIFCCFEAADNGAKCIEKIIDVGKEIYKISTNNPKKFNK